MCLLRLTAAFLSKQKNEEPNNDDENKDDTSHIDLALFGSLQSNIQPFFTQVFELLEKCGKDGISLRKLGQLFVLDFNKSRRICANLQSQL